MHDRVARLRELYNEIHAFAVERDPDLRPRAVVDRSLDSEIVLIAQALGRDTQRLSGFPYVFPDDGLSKGGHVLDRFLAGFGYTIDAADESGAYAYSTDLVPWFPGRKSGGSGDVVPSDEEIALCWRWLETEIALVEPRAVVLLGLPAARAFLSRHFGLAISRSRPKLKDFVRRAWACEVGGRSLSAYVVYHPSGAFQHRAADDVYHWTGAALRRVVTGGKHR